MAPTVLVVSPADPLLWITGLPRNLSTQKMGLMYSCLSLDKVGLLQHYRAWHVKSAKFYNSRLKIKFLLEGSRGRKLLVEGLRMNVVSPAHPLLRFPRQHPLLRFPRQHPLLWFPQRIRCCGFPGRFFAVATEYQPLLFPCWTSRWNRCWDHKITSTRIFSQTVPGSPPGNSPTIIFSQAYPSPPGNSPTIPSRTATSTPPSDSPIIPTTTTPTFPTTIRTTRELGRMRSRLWTVRSA